MSSYGYMNYYTPPKPPKLAQAAAGKDPYGLITSAATRAVNGAGAAAGFAAPSQVSEHGQGGGYTTPATTKPAVASPVIERNVFTPPPTPSAAAVNNYDLNTDPALQSIESLVGRSNSDAQSSALKQRQDLLLAYGDPNVAAAQLGADDPIALAAGQNPTSTVKQLGQSRDRNLKTLDDQLGAANLGFSGYRVTQEQQAGEDYQNALAQAAAGLNSNLDTVGSNLAAALAGNNQQVVAGINSAADRASQQAIATGTDPGAIADPNALAGAAAGGPPAGGGAPAAGASFAGAPQLKSIAGTLVGGANRALQGLGDQGYGGVASAPVDAAARLRKLLQLPG